MNPNNQELNSFTSQVLQFQFPIFGIRQGRQEQQGTCTLLRVEDHYFIITAAHVTNLRHASEDSSLYIYNHTATEFIKITEDIVGHDGSKEIENEFDIAIIRVDRDRYKNIPNEYFLSVYRFLLPGIKVGEHAFMATGYPSSKNRSFPKFKSRMKACVLLTTEVDGNDFAVSELLSINLSYKAQDCPAPNGMSGGAIWILTKDLPCNPVFAGILVAYNTNKNCLIGVKTALIIAMIRAYFPGTILDSINMSFFISPNENGCAIHFPTIRLNHLS